MKPKADFRALRVLMLQVEQPGIGPCFVTVDGPAPGLVQFFLERVRRRWRHGTFRSRRAEVTGFGSFRRLFEGRKELTVVPHCLVGFADTAKMFRILLRLEDADQTHIRPAKIAFPNAGPNAEQLEGVARPAR